MNDTRIYGSNSRLKGPGEDEGFIIYGLWIMAYGVWLQLQDLGHMI